MSIQYSACSAAGSKFEPFRDAAKASFIWNFPAPTTSLSAEWPAIPVLCANFGALGIPLDLRLPSCMGWGSAELENSMALTFRVQVGDRQFMIYANAADPAVWEALDEWEAEGRMCVSLCTAPGQAVVLMGEFSQRACSPDLREHVQWEVQSRHPFLANVSLHIAEHMASVTWSDLPEYQSLGSVHGAIVCTENSSTAEISADPIPAPIVDGLYFDPISRPVGVARWERGTKTPVQKKARAKAKAQAKARAQSRARARGRKC